MNAKSRKVLATTVDSSHLTTNDYLDLRFEELLDRISADGLAPGGGSAAAFTVAFAARLVAMVARCSAIWKEAPGVAAQATAISDRAIALTQSDGRAWDAALLALRDAEAADTQDDAKRDFALERKLEAAAAAPLEIAHRPPTSRHSPPQREKGAKRRIGPTRRRRRHSPPAGRPRQLISYA